MFKPVMDTQTAHSLLEQEPERYEGRTADHEGVDFQACETAEGKPEGKVSN